MPRQARLDAPGVLQHVMARGIERRKIELFRPRGIILHHFHPESYENKNIL
ncbi:MAG: hypothetical protein U9N08_07860 [Candidatus Caldatribacteriota bacterium]|nr:hypothetical protein [Candidatus Caldatribacteriota bacterium]